MLAEKINRVRLKIEQSGAGGALGQLLPVVLNELEQTEVLAKQLEEKLLVPNPQGELEDHELLMDARIALAEMAGVVGECEWTKIKDVIGHLGRVQRRCAKTLIPALPAMEKANA